MKYFKIDSEGTPLEAPIGAVELKRRLNVSLPNDLNSRAMQDFLVDNGYVAIAPNEKPPEIPLNHKVELDIPIKNPDGSYTRTYKFIELSENEITRQSAYVRKKRDALMDEMEWRYKRYDRQVRVGAIPTDNIAELDQYMQALANITKQPGFPFNVEWPDKV